MCWKDFEDLAHFRLNLIGFYGLGIVLPYIWDYIGLCEDI